MINIKVCAALFQMPWVSHLIKSLSFSLSRRNSDLLSTFNHSPNEYSSNFYRDYVMRCLHVYYLFASNKQVSQYMMAGVLDLLTADRRFKPHSVRLAFFFFFLNFSGMLKMLFWVSMSCIYRYVLLNVFCYNSFIISLCIQIPHNGYWPRKQISLQEWVAK